jgi:hypothetical protein
VLVQQLPAQREALPGGLHVPLSTEEFGDLKSQFVMSSGGHGGRRKRPLVFTEQGIAMLSGVLRSDRGIAVNIEIMRAFVELRRVAGSQLNEQQLSQIFGALRQLIASPPRAKRPVG